MGGRASSASHLLRHFDRDEASSVGTAFLKPMRDFDPFMPAIVHDRQTGRPIFWSTKWARRYQRVAREDPNGTVECDEFTFDGWFDTVDGATL